MTQCVGGNSYKGTDGKDYCGIAKFNDYYDIHTNIAKCISRLYNQKRAFCQTETGDKRAVCKKWEAEQELFVNISPQSSS